MNLFIIPYTIEHAKIIASWKYESPYDVYNFPSYEDMVKYNYPYVDPNVTNYHSITNENNELVAVCNLIEEDNQVFFGISVDPKYCGKGLSKELLPIIINYANNLYHKPLYLQVRIWNERAIKAYQNAGFIIKNKAILKTETVPALFYIMKRPS